MTRNALRAWTSDPADFPSTDTGAALLVCARSALPIETATLPRAAAPDLLARIGLPPGGRVTTALNEALAPISGRAAKRIRQTLERGLLRAAKSQYQNAYLNQMVAIGGERSPQLMVRLGRGPSVPHPPRRRLEDVRS